MARIKYDHTSLDHPAFIARLREISTMMTGNPAFPTLGPKIAAMDAAVDALETQNVAYNATVQLAGEQLTIRDAGRDAAEAAALSLGNSSEAETTDAAALQSGGWHLVEPPAPPAPMPAPQNASATGGDLEGEVDFQWDAVDGRDAYIADYAAAAIGPWTQFYIGAKSSCTATGLESGQMYYFRVRAVGPLGPGPWSDIAAKRAT